jgi:AraC-like DNA-binding protein
MMAEALLIALDLHDDLSKSGISELALEFGVPRRTLQRALHREGVTYREIVQDVRMRRAQRLLAATNAPLAEIALRVGYTDPANFHRAFLSQTNTTPGRYRAASRTRNPND